MFFSISRRIAVLDVYMSDMCSMNKSDAIKVGMSTESPTDIP